MTIAMKVRFAHEKYVMRIDKTAPNARIWTSTPTRHTATLCHSPRHIRMPSPNSMCRAAALAASSMAAASANMDTESASFHDGAGVLKFVNPLIGTRGFVPDSNGGMIPSVCPPFGMTRWTPQTRENYISQVPYSDLDRRVHGFQATHQPAIWMGEQGQMALAPGLLRAVGGVRTQFHKRGLSFRKSDETSTPYVYQVLLDADSVGDFNYNLTEQWAHEEYGDACPPCPGGGGTVPDSVREGSNGRARKRASTRRSDASEGGAAADESGSDSSHAELGEYEHSIKVAMSATSHVGHIRFDFQHRSGSKFRPQPYVAVQATRLNWTGHVEIDPQRREVSGSNTQRQEYAIGPYQPKNFSAFFVSRFSAPFESYGTSQGSKTERGVKGLRGKDVGAYVVFDKAQQRVEVRTAVSFVSVEQARRNLDVEIPDGRPLESTVEQTKQAWLEKLGRITIDGANKTDLEHDQQAIFYTALFHALQYPNDYSEPMGHTDPSRRCFYSGYTDSVHGDNDSYYQSWSIWDTYRAEHALLTLLAPERVNSMMRSLLRIFDWSGRLPIWANMVETNTMIATNADAVIANALARGFNDFDIQKAWKAVHTDAYVPPERDTELLYFEREPNTPHEARAGLTSYLQHGWVDNDRWAEAASRTLDYAFDDFAAAVVATHAGDHASAEELVARSRNYVNIWNNQTQFMQTRNANGTFARDDWGWTEGDKWVYTFDVMHDAGGLASLFRGGKEGMKARLDQHFSEGRNMHSNEPSHHVPYLYSAIGYPMDSADKVRDIAWTEYNNTAAGLCGNEDLGQMSAWYVFSALGFYPLNPATDEYVIGTPFFDKVEIRLPTTSGTDGHTLVISAPGAGTQGKAYIKGVKVDGKSVHEPLLKHANIVNAKKIEFIMSSEPTAWGSRGTV
ncbi:Glycosyl hydrolase 92 [Metarhizium album ARSEF 1941]|uniref:Glycosyl hydrolase 92 n=1 Tax=Metarhizium album (strain ARSEF 1941) TaxID=1081103 RepID=A0A0B2X1L1_METAS|nr:Glycosyl hydrolase 92 [Metarhizium album ARSEF 1941]KHN98975.1 Glycosyl hydrolase 92 [Metarhizium album ARSEF 1941]